LLILNAFKCRAIPLGEKAKVAATIIRLKRFNVGCRHHANGVRFPHIYRVTGFEYDFLSEGTNNTRLVPGKTVPVEPFYTLREIGYHGIANATVQPIKSLNPDLDKGWLIIRHHANEQPAHGYIDCISDYHADDFLCRISEELFRTAVPSDDGALEVDAQD